MGVKRKGRGALFYDKTEHRWTGTYTIGTIAGRRVRKKVYGPRGDRSDGARLAVEDKLFLLRKDQPYRGQIAPDTLLADYLESWLRDCDIATKTLETYRWAVNHIVSSLGTKKINAITPAELEKFDRNLSLGENSRASIRRVLNTALRAAVRDGHLIVNPVSLVRWPRRRTVSEIAVWTPEQSLKFLRTARKSEYFALFLVMIAGALGPAEAFGLRWKQVDLKRGSVSIVANLTEVSGKLIYKDVKVPSRRRLVQLPRVALRELVALHAKQKPKADGYVFTAPEGGGIRRSTFGNRVWFPLLKQAGVPRISVYGLRHSSASLLAALGVPLMVASRALGHSNIRTTANVYTHLFPEAQRDVADRLDRFFRDL